MSTGGNKIYRPDGLRRSVQGRVHIWDSGNIIADLLSRIIYSASVRICSRRRRGGAYRENSDMFVSSRARKRRTDRFRRIIARLCRRMLRRPGRMDMCFASSPYPSLPVYHRKEIQKYRINEKTGNPQEFPVFILLHSDKIICRNISRADLQKPCRVLLRLLPSRELYHG